MKCFLPEILRDPPEPSPCSPWKDLAVDCNLRFRPHKTTKCRKKHGSVIALFRPTAILDQLAISLSLAGNKDLTKAVTGYRTSLENTPDSRA
jgi:hypothetical protein